MPSPPPSGRPESWLDRLVRALALLAGAVLVLMVLLTVADVVMRYVFSAPIFGAQDLAELGLLVVVFLGMAHCGRSGGHIAIDIVSERLPRRVRQPVAAAMAAIGAAALLLLAWRSVIAGQRAADFGVGSNLLGIPLAPFHGVIAFGAALYAMVLMAEAVRTLGGQRTGA